MVAHQQSLLARSDDELVGGVVASALEDGGVHCRQNVALEGARPLSKNGYKVALTKAVVERTLVDLLPT